jgi:hypothetical protein
MNTIGDTYQLAKACLYLDTSKMAAKVAKMASQMAAQNAFFGYISSSTFLKTMIVVSIARVSWLRKLLVTFTDLYNNFYM